MSERDDLIARAQAAGVESPWFKTNEELTAAIAAAGESALDDGHVEPEPEPELGESMYPHLERRGDA